MPPAISDDEAPGSGSDNEVIPYKKSVDKVMEDAPEGSDDDEDEEGENEYVVEKILSHAIDKPTNTVLYEVKWLGYEKKADRTWEPEVNLETAKETLQAYFKAIGGRPEAAPKGGKKRKQSVGVETPEAKSTGRGRKKSKPSDSASGTPEAGTISKQDEWVPPKGSWESDVNTVETVEEQPDPDTGERIRYGYIQWNQGRKSRHPLKTLNQKCPQKMLHYYEQHLVFKGGFMNDANGETNAAAGEEEAVDSKGQ